MKNLQVIEKRADGDGLLLDVVDVWQTIQGEGPFAGRPAVFVRLAGCNLQCPLCDTDYTTNRLHYTLDALIGEVGFKANAGTSHEIGLVVITGGEPLRQKIGPFVRRLINAGWEVQIETNGTLYEETLGDETSTSNYILVCSPKGSVNPKLKSDIRALKYVMRADQVDPVDGLPTHALDSLARPERPWPGFRIDRVYLQPCDEQDAEKNRVNLEACIRSCMRFGYTLSLQLHKIAGLA